MGWNVEMGKKKVNVYLKSDKMILRDDTKELGYIQNVLRKK